MGEVLATLAGCFRGLRRTSASQPLPSSNNVGVIVTIGTGDPNVDAIREPDPPQAARRSGTGVRPSLVSENTGLPRQLEPGEARTYMNQALAKRFGPDLGPGSPRPGSLGSGQGDDVEGVGSQFETSRRTTFTQDVQEDGEGVDILAGSDAAKSAAETPGIQALPLRRSESPSKPHKPAGKGTTASTHDDRSTHHTHPPASCTLVSVRESLHNQRRLINSPILCQARRYLPDVAIWEILTLPAVEQLLKECKGPEEGAGPVWRKSSVAAEICGSPKDQTDVAFISYRKVFAALILIGKQSCIFDFIERGLSDGQLPLDGLERWSRRARQETIGSSSSPCAGVFESWEATHVVQFDDMQWELCAPFFKMDEMDNNMKCLHYVFSGRTSLPLENIEEVLGPDGARPGGYGRVFKVDIDDRHHSFPLHTSRGSKQLFAIKKLDYQVNWATQSVRDIFHNESNILSRLNSIATRQDSNHLSKLYATFEVTSPAETTFFFIFPCANSNLKDYWKAGRSRAGPEHDGRLAKWMAEQFCGLAEALHIIHDFFMYKRDTDEALRNSGIHGDIKPENILHFTNWSRAQNEFGVLQIADFGTARYHGDITVQHMSPHNRRWHAYCPPEVELPWYTDQSLDVWALGCLFLEFLVWFLYDYQGLVDFKKARQSPSIVANLCGNYFYDLDEKEGRWPLGRSTARLSLATGVREWVLQLQNHGSATGFIHDLLEFIPSNMLVLEDKSRETTAPVQAATAWPFLPNQHQDGLAPESPRTGPGSPRSGLVSPRAALESPRAAPESSNRGLFGRRAPRKRLRSLELNVQLRNLCHGKDESYYSSAPTGKRRPIPALNQALQTSQSIAQLSTTARINFETRRLHEDVRRRMRQGESRRRDRVLTGRPSTSREHEPLLGIGVTDYGTAA